MPPPQVQPQAQRCAPPPASLGAGRSLSVKRVCRPIPARALGLASDLADAAADLTAAGGGGGLGPLLVPLAAAGVAAAG